METQIFYHAKIRSFKNPLKETKILEDIITLKSESKLEERFQFFWKFGRNFFQGKTGMFLTKYIPTFFILAKLAPKELLTLASQFENLGYMLETIF
jgi:hypothetical protein